MKVYLAGRYERRDELRGYAERFQAIGVEIVSRWLWIDLGVTPEQAMMCLEDLNEVDTLIFFSEDSETSWPRGGRCVEYGIALALGRRLLMVGPRENLFHELLPDSSFFASIDKLTRELMK